MGGGIFVQITQINCDRDLSFKFKEGSTRVTQELLEFTSCESSLSFGDI